MTDATTTPATPETDPAAEPEAIDAAAELRAIRVALEDMRRIWLVLLVNGGRLPEPGPDDAASALRWVDAVARAEAVSKDARVTFGIPSEERPEVRRRLNEERVAAKHQRKATAEAEAARAKSTGVDAWRR